MDRRFFIHALSALGLSAAVLPVVFHSRSRAASVIAALDTDSDSTVDSDEMKAAASRMFDKLDKDADGTLDPKEIGGRLSKKQFKEADPDHDGTLTKNEYVAHAENLFHEADPDADGTLDAKEFRSKAGRALARLVR